MPVHSLEPSAPSGSRAPMVGRTAELAVLRDAYAAARDGAGGAVVVGGEAGIGKTRLVEEFLATLAGARARADDAASDVLVLHGQCADSGSGPIPYAALTGLLADVVDALGPEATLEAAGPAADALGVLAPGLVDVRRDVDTGRLPEVLADLASTLADDRPVVVVVEDLHWSDGITRTVLARLARRAGCHRMLVVGSYRSDDVGRRHPLRTTLAELERSRRVLRVEVPRLDAGEVAQLAAALVDDRPRPGHLADEAGTATIDRDLLRDVVERSEGVPFYVEELTEFAGTAVPDSLRDVLLLRYSTLSDAAQTLCRTVAAAGQHASYDLLASALGDDALAAAEGAAREAVDAHVLRADTGGYRFRHALMQEAVAEELLPGESRRLHSAFARALEAGPDTLATQAAAADHWWRARVVDRALASAVRVAAAAEADAASSTAIAIGERALELWDLVPDAETVAGVTRPELLQHVAASLRLAARLDRAEAIAREAVDTWPADDPAGQAGALATLAHIVAKAGSPESDPLIARALDLLPADDAAGRAPLLRLRARNAMIDGRYDEAIESAAAGYEAAMSVGDTRNASMCVNLSATSRIDLGDLDALAELDRARELAGDDWFPLSHYYTNASDARIKLGDFRRAAELAETGAARARALGAGWASRSMLEGNVAESRLGLGQWAEAEAWYEQSVPLIDPSDYAVYQQERATWLAMWRGRLDTAQEQARRLRPTWERYARLEMQIRARTAATLGELALLRDDLDDALGLVAVAADPGALTPSYRLPLLGVAARAIGRARADGRDVDDTPYRASLAGCTGWPTYPVWAALFAAELGDGSWEAVAEADGPAHLRPYALFRDGRSLLAAGDRPAARARLEDAVAAAEEIGCGLVADQARELLAGAGLARHAAGPDGAGRERSSAIDRALTDRERQVLELVADGLTNGQIAERLFISRKTASVHVSAILRKLQVASRTEAAVLARAHGG
ncbi:ATP-binding protein [Isoptericola hypogeus]|uniref:ATP-binding protein n=1 Tax=Isoptericola hypogeus TaxID=300179 RepID=UPI0031DE098B